MHENWMENLAAVNSSIRIRDMVIPATHDVGTYSINKREFFSFSAITQRLSVYDQLCVGSRNLDLRYGGHGEEASEVYVWHGPYRGAKLEAMFQQICKFISENNKEFVLVQIQKEQGINEAQKQYIIGLVMKYLTPLAITDKDDWFTHDTVTIGQVINHKRNLYLLVDTTFLLVDTTLNHPDYTDYGGLGMYMQDIFYQSDWANVNKVGKLFKYDLKRLKHNSMQQQTFLGTQMILTLKDGPLTILDYIVGEDSLRIDHLTKMLQKKHALAKFFLDNIDTQPFNYVELDYIDFNPGLVKFLIGLNFPFKLNIIKASVDSTDVTATLQGKISRGRVLFLPDIKENLGLNADPKRLTIEFIYQGDAKSVTKTFDVKQIQNEFILTYIDISHPRTT